jgi:hypothetical protein
MRVSDYNFCAFQGLLLTICELIVLTVAVAIRPGWLVVSQRQELRIIQQHPIRPLSLPSSQLSNPPAAAPRDQQDQGEQADVQLGA